MAQVSLPIQLRVVQVWNGAAHEERTFAWTENSAVTVGSQPGCTFTVPHSAIGERFPLFRSTPGGFTVGLAPGMSGTLHLGGRNIPIRTAGGELLSGNDWGIVGLDGTGRHAFYFELLPPSLPMQGRFDLDGFLLSALAFALFIHMSVLIAAWFANDPPSDNDLATSPERVAKLILDKDWPPKPTPEEEEKEKKKKGGDERKVREEDMSKKAAGKEGKFGDPKSPHKETKIAKGPRDIIVQKVQNTGILGIVKAQKGDSSIAKLLSNDRDATMSTALAGLEGVQTQIGQGAGGMGFKGTGPGGGGTGRGQLFGTGNLDVGSGGNNTHHTGGGAGHVAKETSVGISPSSGTSDGSLTKEQIYKVVASHAAAIQFCFEKELQRFPHLSGKVTLSWRVELDGRVSNAAVANSSLGNPGTEGCMVRQLKTWVFPKPQGTVAQVTFPFLFKGQ
jgi:hypothetical protein